MKLIKVRDRMDENDVYIHINAVHTIDSPFVARGNDWWCIETESETMHVDEVDARRVIAAFEDEDLSALSTSELQVEWERTEARMVRVGAEMSRRAH